MQAHTKKTLSLSAILIGGAVLLALALGLFKKEAPKGQASSSIPLVSTELLSLVEAPYILRANGIAKSKKQATVASQVVGEIVEVSESFLDGKIVSADQWLIRVENSRYLAELASAKSLVAQAKIQLSQEQKEAEVPN